MNMVALTVLYKVCMLMLVWDLKKEFQKRIWLL